jgi:hypothetical protein
MNRTPMKRTAFKRAPRTTAKTESNRSLALDERAQRAIKNAQSFEISKFRNLGEKKVPTPIPKAPVAINCVATSCTAICAIPKDLPIRSQAYLRLVAQLPCMHCGIWGYSQAAHANTGKGMALKACDLQTFPLCCDRPGQRGCHCLFDQGALFGKEARRLIEPAWVADTQRRIHAMGIWPKKYPYPLVALELKALVATNSGAI